MYILAVQALYCSNMANGQTFEKVTINISSLFIFLTEFHPNLFPSAFTVVNYFSCLIYIS